MTDSIITAAELHQLAEHEAVIERGIKTFYEVGVALSEIRNRRLYREDHDTFEAYCQQRWNISRPRAYELMQAAQVVSGMPDTLPAPTSARQASELARVPVAERTAVWQETLERTAGKPTAAAIRETYAPPSAPSDDDLLTGTEWSADPEDLVAMAGLETVTPTVIITQPPPPEPAKPKRRPLPEAFADATRDLKRAAEQLGRLTQDDRFTRNREQTHHQMPDLITALEHTTALLQAMNLPQAPTSEEARRWWETSLNKTSDALTGIARSINQEN